MKLRLSLKGRPILTILVIAMLGVGLACAGEKATPTSPPTATTAPTATATTAPTATLVPTATATLVPGAPTPTATAVPTATATAVPTPTVDIASLPWIERYMRSAGYKPEWGQPQTGGILKAGLAKGSQTFVPAMGSPFQAPMFQTYNQLVRFDPWVGLSSIIPDLAKSWEISGDGLTYTFKLEEGVKFQDNPNIPERLRNADFTCEDVVASVERYLRSEIWDAQGGTITLGHVNSITCPDGPLGYTAALNLDSPKAKTLASLATDNPAMMDKDWWEWVRTEIGAAQKVTNNESYKRMTGSGPFVPVEFKPDLIAKIRRNPTYFREGLPLLDGIDSYILKDSTTRFTALATGNINLYGHGSSSMLPGQVAQAERDFKDRIAIHAAPYALGYGLVFNTGRAPYDDVRVLKAIFLAVDRDDYLLLRRAGSYEGAILATDVSVPGSYWTATEEELRTWPGYRQPKDQDVAEANRLLDEVFGKGKRFSASCMAQSSQTHSDICLFFGDQMKKSLNVTVSMEFLEVAVESERAKQCQFGIQGMSVGSLRTGDPDDSWFAHYHREYIARPSSFACAPDAPPDPVLQAGIEAEMDAMSIQMDPVKRREMVRALDWKITQEVLYEQTFGWLVIFYGTTPNVKGFYLMDNPMRTYHHIFERTWLAK